jgi:hypothetical protein
VAHRARPPSAGPVVHRTAGSCVVRCTVQACQQHGQAGRAARAAVGRGWRGATRPVNAGGRGSAGGGPAPTIADVPSQTPCARRAGGCGPGPCESPCPRAAPPTASGVSRRPVGGAFRWDPASPTSLLDLHCGVEDLLE